VGGFWCFLGVFVGGGCLGGGLGCLGKGLVGFERVVGIFFLVGGGVLLFCDGELFHSSRPLLKRRPSQNNFFGAVHGSSTYYS